MLSAGCQAQLLANLGDSIAITNGTMLYIGGSFVNYDIGSKQPWVNNDGILKITGDFISPSDMLYLGNDSTEIAGSGTQNFAGLTFYSLKITGPGTKTMLGNAYVTNAIELAGGSLNTGSDTLILDSNATMYENETNNVIGNVTTTRNLLTNTDYTNGNMGMEIQTGSNSPGMTTVFRKTGPDAIQSGNGNQSIARYYDIIPSANGGLNATLTIHYLTGDLNGISQSDLAVYRSHDDGSTWKYMGFTTEDAAQNTVTLADVDSFSRWTLGSQSSPLPVEMLFFNAQLNNAQSALLTWATASELNCSYFDIERSTDGVHFIKTGEKPGHGNSLQVENYSFTDNFGNTGVNTLYYRLRQVDENGNYSYSKVREISIDGKINAALNAWYDGSSGNIAVAITGGNQKTFNLQLSDARGNFISRINASPTGNIAEFNITASTLSPGLYFITAMGNDQIQTIKVLKY